MLNFKPKNQVLAFVSVAMKET